MQPRLQVQVFASVRAQPPVRPHQLPRCSQAEQELRLSPYFHLKQDGSWGLSIYQPLKWGVVGTGQIAEDVVEIINLIPGANPVWSVSAKDSQEDADTFAESHSEPLRGQPGCLPGPPCASCLRVVLLCPAGWWSVHVGLPGLTAGAQTCS